MTVRSQNIDRLKFFTHVFVFLSMPNNYLHRGNFCTTLVMFSCTEIRFENIFHIALSSEHFLFATPKLF